MRAIVPGRTGKDLVAEFLRQGLGMESVGRAKQRPVSSMVKSGENGLPVVQCTKSSPATRMGAGKLLALEQEALTKEDLQSAGSHFDANVWIAAIFPTHPFHRQIQAALQKATPAAPAMFCRSTQQSFLRRASPPVLLKAYGAEGLTNRDALVALEALLARRQVCERAEPPALVALWHGLAARDTPSPKVWRDA